MQWHFPYCWWDFSINKQRCVAWLYSMPRPSIMKLPLSGYGFKFPFTIQRFHQNAWVLSKEYNKCISSVNLYTFIRTHFFNKWNGTLGLKQKKKRKGNRAKFSSVHHVLARCVQWKSLLNLIDTVKFNERTVNFWALVVLLVYNALTIRLNVESVFWFTFTI